MTLEKMIMAPSLYTIRAILVLDNDGKRLLSKYYNTDHQPMTVNSDVLEKKMFQKASKNPNGEIFLYEGYTIVFKNNVDLFFFVIGESYENELVLMNALNTFYDTCSQILRKNVEKRAMLSNLDLILLALDEICDEGILLEADPSAISLRVGKREEDVPLGEQTVAQVIQTAKDQIKWSLLK